MIFNVANDSPTLTGAKVTFTISLEFPHNQKVLPNGDVVWAEDCVLNGETQPNVCFLSPVPPEFVLVHPSGFWTSVSSPLAAGTKYAASEPVFPTQDPDWEPVFPDGTPMKKDKKPNYVFVWKAWGERSAHTLVLGQEVLVRLS